MKIKNKIITIILGVIIIVAALIYFVILPSVSEIMEISNRIYLERLGLEERYQRGQSLRESLLEYKKNKDKIHVLAAAYIQNGEELSFLNQIEKIAISNNIELEKTFTDPAEAPEVNSNFLALSLELKSTGNFINIVNFLHQLESLDVYININTVNIAKKEVGRMLNADIQKGQSNIFGAFRGTTFWQEKKIETDNGKEIKTEEEFKKPEEKIPENKAVDENEKINETNEVESIINVEENEES